jgi:hypothetical protein
MPSPKKETRVTRLEPNELNRQTTERGFALTNELTYTFTVLLRQAETAQSNWLELVTARAQRVTKIHRVDAVIRNK